MTEKKTGYPSIDKPWLQYYPPHAHEDAWKEVEDTIYNKLYSRSTAWMDNYAIDYFGTKITYQDMFKIIDNVANTLVAEGIGEEDACMLCLPNIPEVIYFTYAINKIGGVACLVDPRTNSEGILERVIHAKVKLLIVIEDIFDKKIKPIMESLNNTGIIVCSADDSLKSINFQALAVKAKYLFRHNHKGNGLKEYGVFLENGKQFEAKTAQ